MVTYSWQKINNKFDWNYYNVVAYFFLKENVKVPADIKKGITTKVVAEAHKPYPKGPCFILNLKELLESNSRAIDIYNYLEIASLRNGFDYKVRHTTTVPLALLEEYHLQYVDSHPLIEVENETIYLKYEEQR